MQPESCRADSRFAPSQWETALLCNDVSHWLGTSLESALVVCWSCWQMSMVCHTTLNRVYLIYLILMQILQFMIYHVIFAITGETGGCRFDKLWCRTDGITTTLVSLSYRSPRLRIHWLADSLHKEGVLMQTFCYIFVNLNKLHQMILQCEPM